MNETITASVLGQGTYRQIAIKNEVRAPIERVWGALSSQEEIHCWWTSGCIEPHEGGRFALGEQSQPTLPGAGPPLTGTIRIYRPPHILAFDWHPAYPEAGLVRFDLIDTADQATQVTLVQNVPTKDVLAATAGWFELVERLGQYAETNLPVPVSESPSRFDQLKVRFERDGIQ